MTSTPLHKKFFQRLLGIIISNLPSIIFHFLTTGVYRTEPKNIYIDINEVKELHDYSLTSNNLILGANMSLTRTMQVMNKAAAKNPNNFGYLKQLSSHIDLIANVPIRNVIEYFLFELRR